MKNTFCLLLLLATTSALAQTNRVGIGTTTPRAGLDLSHNDGLAATGAGPGLKPAGPGPKEFPDEEEYQPGPGNVAQLPTGAGTRLLWVPAYSALRAGTVAGDDWNTAQLGLFSTALGRNVTASGEGSVAIGSFVSTNGFAGSFVLGGGGKSEAVMNADRPFQLMAGFAGGYKFFTNSQRTVGVELVSNGNAWSTLSDSTKKEGFRPADGQAFLQKIARMRLGSWNYRGQDAKTFRHYGPMAQDFFAAFGHDGIGTVGNDTSINQADFDGVNLIAIKALIEKTERLEAENADLRRQLGQVVADVQALKAQASR